MDNKNLFKEAIADAKAVREAALANAKAALEEALTPKLQSMLAAKLQEMDLNEEEKDEEDGEKVEEGFYPDITSDPIQDRYRATGAALEEGDDELEEEFDLSEILAELEEETLNEAEEAEEEEEESEEEEAEEEEEEGEEEMDVADMSVEDLKDLIKDIVAQEVGGAEASAEEEPAMDMGDEAGEEAGAEDEIDLEELLAELDSLDEYAEEQPSRDMDGDGDVDADDVKMMKEAKKKKKEKEEKEEMKEALATIQTLRNELNEVNLLNAKLLYVNKIFKAKNLTESQKVQVIASFDKATNVKEAKVVFESLQATLTAAPAKKAIKESLGFASKAAGVAPNKTIVESNDVITRMQKLANIIK
jgi:hypothetical protein